MALKLKTQPKGKGKTTTEAQADIGKSDLKRSALEAWKKLDAVIQNELTAIEKGDKELTASTATAVIKFIEASASLASSPEDVSPKDAADRQQALMEKIRDNMPTFDDEEGDEFSSSTNH